MPATMKPMPNTHAETAGCTWYAAAPGMALVDSFNFTNPFQAFAFARTVVCAVRTARNMVEWFWV
jgi:hypothetical protein